MLLQLTDDYTFRKTGDKSVEFQGLTLYTGEIIENKKNKNTKHKKVKLNDTLFTSPYHYTLVTGEPYGLDSCAFVYFKDKIAVPAANLPVANLPPPPPAANLPAANLQQPAANLQQPAAKLPPPPPPVSNLQPPPAPQALPPPPPPAPPVEAQAPPAPLPSQVNTKTFTRVGCSTDDSCTALKIIFTNIPDFYKGPDPRIDRVMREELPKLVDKSDIDYLLTKLTSGVTAEELNSYLDPEASQRFTIDIVKFNDAKKTKFQSLIRGLPEKERKKDNVINLCKKFNAGCKGISATDIKKGGTRKNLTKNRRTRRRKCRAKHSR